MFKKCGLVVRKIRFKNATLGLSLVKIFSNTGNISVYGDHELCNKSPEKIC